MHKQLVIVVLAVACGKSKSSDKQSGDKQAAQSDEHVSNHTLATTPLKTLSSQAGAIAFTIDLPVAALKPVVVKDTYATWDAEKAWFDTPSFTVQFKDVPLQPESTGDSEPFGEDASDRVIARAERLPEGGYLNVDQRKDKAFFRVEVCRPTGAGALCCTVIARNAEDKPLDAFDEIVGLAEKVCRSMKAKS